MKKYILAVFFTFLFAISSCQKKEQRLPITQGVRINFAYPPLSIDPRKSTEPITCVMSYMLFEGLMHLEPDGKVSLALAENVQASKDRKSYLFTLRSSHWSDGTPLTAYDFECAWKKTLSPSYPSKSAYLLFSLKNGLKAKQGECSLDDIGVKALDEKTLLVNLENPNPFFLHLTAYPTYFPVPNQGIEIPYPQNGSTLISNGPFTLVSWKSNNEIVVEKNPSFWDADTIRIERIHVSLIEDEATALSLYEKRKIDWLGGLISPLPLDAISSLKSSEELYKRPIAGTTFCSFNTKEYPFHNLNIRKAFAYAINRQSLTENVTQMPDDIASGIIPPVLKNYQNPTLFPDYQVELARKYFKLGLEELGISSDEFPIVTYSYFTSELHRKLAMALQGQWQQALGIHVNLECCELKLHVEKLCRRQYEFAQMSWIAQYFDQMNYLERLKSESSNRNYTAWESPLFGAYLEESNLLDSNERFHVLEKAEKLVAEEVPMTPFYHYHVVYLKNPKLKNVEVSPLGDVQFRKAYIE